jgi:hypothetical protein
MEAMTQAGAVACMSKDEELAEIVDAILGAVRR